MDGIVQQRRAAPGEARVDRREALRYMGCAGILPGGEINALIESCTEELLAILQPRCCWLEVPVAFPAPYAVDVGFGPVQSVALGRHLQGCGRALLFAATVGIGVERLVARYQRLTPRRAAVIDALGLLPSSAGAMTWKRHCSETWSTAAASALVTVISNLRASVILHVALTCRGRSAFPFRDRCS